MLKAVLMDDEKLALDLLEAMLREIGEVEIIGKFLSAAEGLRSIERLQPDLLFLDIEMPEMNGINVADQMENKNIDVVFVTAYDEYALKAFNVGAVDYVLKPIEKERLKKTIDNILKRRRVYKIEDQQQLRIKASFLDSFSLFSVKEEKMKWRTKKVKELCAFLLHHSSPVHKDRILEELWSDLPPDKATPILYTSVYQLRKEFRKHGFEKSITYMDARYSLMIKVDDDLQDVKQLINQTTVTSGDISKLLNLYKGDYLAQEDYPWSIDMREQLRKQIIQYLEKYVASVGENQKKQSVFKDAIHRLIEFDPWEERYTCELMKYYIKQGNLREAIHIFERYKGELWREMGMTPKKHMEELIQNHI